MRHNSPLKRRVSLAAATFIAFFSTAAIGFFLHFLADQAKAAVPFAGHTLQLGPIYVYSNWLAVFLLILSVILLAHSLGRMALLFWRWRMENEDTQNSPMAHVTNPAMGSSTSMS